MSVPLLGTGEVRHRRLRPVAHAFAYRSCFLLLPMRALRAAPCAALPRNRRGLVSFQDRDHGDGRADSLAWLEQTLAAHGVADAGGEVWLQCFPRVLGYAFKPVSFWYCLRADDSLAAVLVEVHNTFGERHCYLLDGPEVAWGRELQARKAFHVSPFCRVEGGYRFRFLYRGARSVVRIDHDNAGGPLLQTSLAGRLAPLTRARLAAAFLAMPLHGLAVVARIHLQALRLWLRRVPVFRKPAPPDTFVTR